MSCEPPTHCHRKLPARCCSAHTPQPKIQPGVIPRNSPSLTHSQTGRGSVASATAIPIGGAE